MQLMQLKNKNSYINFLAITILFLICFSTIRLIGSRQLQNQLVLAYIDQYESLELMEELKNSSDDLTSMIRLYCVTKDPKYKQYYYDILDIRNGKLPRPVDYNDTYWDLKLADMSDSAVGKAVALKELMIKRGFTIKEYSLLQESENLSNNLVLLEVRAMNALEGKFLDDQGKYTKNGPPDQDLAESIVFGKSYIDAKANIMKPINEFQKLVKERTKSKTKDVELKINNLSFFGIIISFSTILLMVFVTYATLKYINNKNRENELLLLNILPAPIAERLKGGEEKIADEYPQASVLFTDIVGFTEQTELLGSQNMVGILNELFDIYDDLCEEYKVEKIKTIGDSYMAVSGVPIPRADHAIVLADFSLALKDATEQFAKRKNIPISVRIGMTFGKVFAGVIGRKKFIYDLWGDVVNIASRMETTGVPGEIQVTDKMASVLEEQFELVPREPIEVKGKGLMHTYFLKKRRKEFEIGKILEIKGKE